MGNQAGCHITGTHQVGLTATNPAASTEFYRDVLGIEIVGGSAPDLAGDVGKNGVGEQGYFVRFLSRSRFSIWGIAPENAAQNNVCPFGGGCDRPQRGRKGRKDYEEPDRTD
jgi:catechol 2,3-dioxygenase-like lactoylglutathione lyase family enzyme